MAEFLNMDLNQKELQDTVTLTSKIFNCPIASINLVSNDTVYLKVKKGTTLNEYPLELSYCIQSIKHNRLLIIPDTLQDDYFGKQTVIPAIPGTRFYAGAPLITPDGFRIGTLCVLDYKPHVVTEPQRLMLKVLSKHIMSVLEAKRNIYRLDQSLIELNAEKEKSSKNEVQLRSLFESLTDVYVFLGLSGEIIDFNRSAFNQILAQTGKRMTYGTYTADYLRKEDNDAFLVNFFRALHGERMQLEMETFDQPGNRICWDSLFEPIVDHNGRILGVSFIARNVNNRKLDEEKIIEQNQLLTRIAHIHAHEYRGSVCAILGMMYLIEQEGYEVTREYWVMLQSAVRGLDAKTHEVINLINGLKEMTGHDDMPAFSYPGFLDEGILDK
jgi:PAS domain S-box-containing protein